MLLPSPPAELADLPRVPGLPLVGNTVSHVVDAYAHSRRAAAYGPVTLSYIFGKWRVTLEGADAARYVLTDPDRFFSSKEGQDILYPFFTGGLPVRDFDDHRRHRRIMQAAFRADAMRGYVKLMADEVSSLLGRLPKERSFPFASAIKAELLRMGGKALMGLDVESEELAALNQAFIDEQTGCVSIVRKPLPFTRFRRGLKAREFLMNRLGAMIPERIASGGDDFFSQMCRSLDDEEGWTEQEILDHFNFLMLAAYDTNASSMTTMAWGLGRDPDWQDAVAEEARDLVDDVEQLHASGDAAGLIARLGDAPRLHWSIMEAMRLMPPAPFLSRTPLQAFEWHGVQIPTGVSITIPQWRVMRDPCFYTAPDRFDAERFSPDREEHRAHPFAWIPFGGGAHKCIGMHFAQYQMRLIMANILARFRIELDTPDPRWAILPVPRPKDGLPLRLVPRA